MVFKSTTKSKEKTPIFAFVSVVFRFANDSTSYYLNEVFEFSPEFSINFRNEFLKLKHPFPKS